MRNPLAGQAPSQVGYRISWVVYGRLVEPGLESRVRGERVLRNPCEKGLWLLPGGACRPCKEVDE